MSLIKDRAAGVLIGLAAGDTIGGPVRMAHLLAQRLLAQQAFNADDVRQQYLTWWRDDGFDTGPTAAHVFELIEGGMSPEGAVRQVHEWHNRLTAGCNPAHRAPVMAAAAFLPDETLFRHAADEAALTHYDPLAGEVSAAVVMLCRALIRGVEWDDACKAVAGKLPPR
ncbi:MAG: ADP-ribosylglycohydrolase family protein, partial [Chloroflexota bacterium]